VKRRILVVTVACGAVLGLSQIVAAQGKDAAAGEKVYAARKCVTCHSIAGKGQAKGPLDGIGAKLSAADIREWLVNPKEMATKAKATRTPAMPSYKSLPAADLDALVAYIQSLKK
jgi:mono/diheme cytochrome c family protein